MAAGLQDAFRQAGICVPDDISLICNDTVNETLPGYLHLTSVDQEPQVMGSAAVDLLFERINNPNQPPHQILYSPALQECGSVKQLIEYNATLTTDGNFATGRASAGADQQCAGISSV